MQDTDYVIPEYSHKIDHLVSSSKRLSGLREWMIETVPCFPASSDTKSHLRKMSLDQLMRVYINWIDRFIPTNPRQPMVWDGFWTRNNPRQYADQINVIIEKARVGEDLTPYLSQKVHTHGFVPYPPSRRGVNWGDKDMALNAYDVHHLHLIPANKNRKRKGDSKHLLYVGVSREEFRFLMLGNHNSFDDGTLAEAVAAHRADSDLALKGVVGLSREMSAKESQQLARHGISTPMIAGNKVVLGAMISSVGTASGHVIHVDRCCEVIERNEEVIDDRSRLMDWLQLSEEDVPEKPDWRWQFYHANLYLVECCTAKGFLVCKWRR
ncbi:hypothetical protein PsAD13_01108 [Pseudovibrio sp. Ad13]|uniref:hypothetical protein n=1 Tax=Pseudovibrio sp. Ad13 TaxID=989396 RepID=UPI0007B2DC5A|nr:hypothetical protein [Pseudovibrio sp. Ad13]KZK85977.1 hypothetical protein PsAD13_01108 [Pseudovibrio sp. Ad13]